MTEASYDSSTRKISKLYDQTLFEKHASQTTTANQPTLCSRSAKINNRYYLQFNGTQRMISDINLNPQAGETRYYQCIYFTE